MNHTNHIKNIKHKIARWLFADEVEKIDVERKAFVMAKEAVEADRDKYREWMMSRTITDAMREQLHGFDFKENGFYPS